MPERTTTSRGEIAWNAVGDGPPVVLVHGSPSRAHVWREVAPSLAAAGHRVYTYDLLGFGDSERHVDQDVSIAAHAEVLRELIDGWGLERPAVVGHDIGGAIVLRAHLIEGVPYSGIALIDAVVLAPWITSRTRELLERRDGYEPLPSARLENEIGEHLRSATSTRLPDADFGALFGQWKGEEGQRLYLRNAARFDEDHTREFEPRLGEIDVPVLIVWGAEDAWLPVEVSERLEAALPTSRRVVLDGAGHFSMEDRPQAVASELADFLGRRS